MKNLILLLAILTASCSDYKNDKFVCNGTIMIHTVYKNGEFNYTNTENEILAMSIEGDKVNFSGNDLLLGNNLTICKIGSVEFAKKDEMFFTNDLCSLKNSNEKEGGRQFGTFNFITKELHFTNERGNSFDTNSGTFKCKVAE